MDNIDSAKKSFLLKQRSAKHAMSNGVFSKKIDEGFMKAADTIDTAVPMLPAVSQVMRAVAGFAVIISCLEGGILVQRQLNIPVPGNVLGMVLLLILLQMKVVPDAWVQGPSTWLLLLLPACFVPIYAGSLSDPALWHYNGIMLLMTGIIGVAATLSLTGGSPGGCGSHEPGDQRLAGSCLDQRYTCDPLRLPQAVFALGSFVAEPGALVDLRGDVADPLDGAFPRRLRSGNPALGVAAWAGCRCDGAASVTSTQADHVQLAHVWRDHQCLRAAVGGHAAAVAARARV